MATSISTTPAGTSARAQSPLRDVRRFWRVLLAVAAPLGPLAMAVSSLLDDVAPAVSPVVWLVGIFTLLPGVGALAWVVRRRSPRLAAIGGIAAFAGYAYLVSAPASSAIALLDVDGLSSAQAARLASAVDALAQPTAMALGFLVLHTVGLVVLAVALWRTRVAPRWMAVCLAAATVLDIPVHVAGSTPLVVVDALVLTVGFAAASVALLRLRDAELALPPGRDPAPVATGGAELRPFWRWTLGLTAGLFPASIAVMRFLMPFDTPDATDVIAQKSIDAVGFSQAALWLGLASPVVVTGVVATAWASFRLAPRLTTVALIVEYVGFLPLAAGAFPSDAVVVAGTRLGLPRQVLVDLLVASDGLPAGMISGSLFLVGHVVGTVLLGIAALRARSMPRALAWGLVISQPLHVVAAVILASHPLDLVAWGLTAVGFTAAGWTLIRTRDEQFDLGALA